MSVYFARVGRYVKVGFSESPERRVANLFQSATRYGMPKDAPLAADERELLAVVSGTTNDEQAAHAALDEFRVFGEWFIDEPEVRDYIAASVDCDGPAALLVERPTGPFLWDQDPILRPDWAAHRAAADAISAALSPQSPTSTHNPRSVGVV